MSLLLSNLELGEAQLQIAEFLNAILPERTSQFLARMPVYGRTTKNRPFRDITETNAVSVHWGLLALAAKVKRGQTVLLVNARTEEERECRIVYVESSLWGKREIGVEFANHGGDFWRVYPSLIRSK